jgi:hypothetical protein
MSSVIQGSYRLCRPSERQPRSDTFPESYRDATRLPYVEVLADEQQGTAIGFLIRAVAQGLLEVCPSRPGSLATATMSFAGTALRPCRPSLLNPPPLAN